MDTTMAADISASFVGASERVNYSIKYGVASTETWTTSTTRTQKWTIYSGWSICIYQYVFEGFYDSMKLGFSSNIYADTNCAGEPPNLIHKW